MSTPEDNVPKNEDTDQAAMKPDGAPKRNADRRKTRRGPDTRNELGAELEDKMAEKGLSRDDFSES